MWPKWPQAGKLQKNKNKGEYKSIHTTRNLYSKFSAELKKPSLSNQ